MATAFVFPGQGSQAVGMGKGLAEAFAPARDVFQEVDAALGEKLSETMWNGPAETLTLTENAQPALMAVSLAALRARKPIIAIGLAYAAQEIAAVPATARDARLDLVLTERAVIDCRKA